MASLCIKDSETAELATELAARLGATKTEVVRDLSRRRKVELTPSALRPSLRERMHAWREAHPRCGKGRHPARLNMGNCFAYACAKANDAELLYNRDDFALTDIA